MPQSITNFDAALKDNYGPGLRNAINNSNPIFTEAMKNDEDIIGRKAVWSVHTSRSASTGARAELAALPTADRQRYTQVQDDLAFVYHTIKVSGQAKALTKNDTGSFVRALESELDGAEKDLKNDQARQVFGQALTDGTNLQTGVLTTLTADPGTGTTWTVANATDPEMRYFFVGMKFAIVNPASGAVRAGGPFTITAINRTTKVLTTTESANGAEASADYVVRADGATIGLTNFANEINGLRFLVNATQKYANIDPASVPNWAATTAGSSTTAISEVLLDQAVESVETDGDGSTPNLYIVANTQRRKLASQLQAQKRWDGKETKLKAGWRGLDIAQGTLLVDRYCPENDGFAITTRELSRFVGLDFTWDDDDGKVLFKALDGSDAVEARFKAYHNLEVPTRNAHCRITLSSPVF